MSTRLSYALFLGMFCLLHFTTSLKLNQNDLKSALVGYNEAGANHFWFSTLGVFLKVNLDIFVIGCTLHISSSAFKLCTTIKECLKISFWGHSAYLIKLALESALINYSTFSYGIIESSHLDLGTLFGFLRAFNVSFPPSLSYLLQNLGLFELLVALFLTIAAKNVFRIKLFSSLMMVASGYILPLAIWLTTISALILLVK